MHNLNQIIKLALAAHDFEGLKVHSLAALICLNFNNPHDAIEHYKLLRNIVEATNDVPLKLHVYTQLGKCYQLMKEYLKAVKAFK